MNLNRCQLNKIFLPRKIHKKMMNKDSSFLNNKKKNP